MKKWLAQLAHCLLDARCPACFANRPDPTLCSSCRALPLLETPHCPCCGMTMPRPATLCGECLKRQWRPLHQIRSALWLNEAGRALIHQIKFQSKLHLLKLFEPYLPSENPFSHSATLIPVPLSRNRFATRTFNQSEWFAARLAEIWSSRTQLDGLQKVLDTEAQSTLSRRDRLKNLKASFEWQAGVSLPSEVILVDDVLTTGATLLACARALKKAGVRQVSAWTLLRAPK